MSQWLYGCDILPGFGYRSAQLLPMNQVDSEVQPLATNLHCKGRPIQGWKQDY
jgi:hypothetical protein